MKGMAIGAGFNSPNSSKPSDLILFGAVFGVVLVLALLLIWWKAR